MADAFESRSEKPRDVMEVVPHDPAWVKMIPAGSRIVATSGHGSSYWSQTARIETVLEDGQEETYFLKLTTSATMVEGEFKSMQALHNVSSDIVPKPLGYGRLEADPTTSFFLCEFIDMYDDLPDIVDFCRDIAELHEKSKDQNTRGQFGFEVTTCNGTVPQDNTWSPSWEAFFINSLKHEFSLEVEVQGPCEEYDILLPALYEKVCPALLRPLETEGRVLRPCLVHGDLWDGNTGIDTKSGRSYIFDASAMWAHNEYELSTWRGARYRMTRSYVDEYFRHFPQSPPESAWEDRNLLYSVRADLHDSILYPSTNNFRDLILTSLRELVDKYPRGYTGSAVRKDEQTNQPAAPLAEGLPVHSEPEASSIDAAMPRQLVGMNLVTLSLANPDDLGLVANPTSEAATRDVAFGESAISPPEGSVVNET